MALKKPFMFRGLAVAEGYHRIRSIMQDLDSKSVVLSVATYTSEAERRAMPGSPLQTSTFTLQDRPAAKQRVTKEDGTVVEVETTPASTAWTDFTAALGTKNPQQAGYAFLKSRAEFSGSEDV